MKLPKGWELKTIGAFAEVRGGIQKGPHREPSNSPVRYLTVAHVQRNRVILNDPRFFEVSQSELEHWRLLPLDVLIIEGNGSSDQIGRAALFKGEIKDCVHQNHVIRVRTDHRIASPVFLNSFLNSSFGKTAVQAESMSSSGLRTLSVGRIKEIAIPLPPLSEQRKIADILCTWDEALEKLDALIAAKERRKKGLMQQLLTGKRRVRGFSEKWQRTSFGEFLHESRNPGSHGLIAHKITVKLYGKGVYAKQERMVGSENTKYFIRHTGQFIYSKLDFLNGAFGIVPHSLDGFESTQDLPAFDVAKKCDARWLLAYVARPEFYTRQVGAAAGGRKARRVNPPEFLALPVNLPALPEQRAIADILDACDDELRLLRDRRAAIERQKRGLMQRLLTGRTRTHGRTKTDTDGQRQTRTDKDKHGQARTGVREGQCESLSVRVEDRKGGRHAR